MKKYKIFALCLIIISLTFDIAYADDNYEWHNRVYQNTAEFETCNITQWQEHGYTGKGVKVAIIDHRLDPSLRFFDNKVATINYFGDNSCYNSHGQYVADIIHQVAPDAEIYALNIAEGGNAIGWCIKNNINIINVSWTGICDLNNQDQLAYDDGIFLVTSAGNRGRGDGDMGNIANDDKWLSVGAVHLINNEPIRAGYSSYGEGLDIIGLSNLHTWRMSNVGNPYHKNSRINGTSISSPFVAGMISLYHQYYYETRGVFPSNIETKKFIYENCIDLEDEGYDIYTGHGLFILPNLDLIENNEAIYVEKVLYTMDENSEGTIWLDNINYAYGYLYYDDGYEEKNINGRGIVCYTRIAKGYMFPLQIGGFSEDAIREKDQIERKSKMMWKRNNR